MVTGSHLACLDLAGANFEVPAMTFLSIWLLFHGALLIWCRK